MINLNNETDYKLLDKTNIFYNFFILVTLILFLAISLEPKSSILATIDSALPAIIIAYTYWVIFEL